MKELEEANSLELQANSENQNAEEMEDIATYILLSTEDDEQGECLLKQAEQIRYRVAEMVTILCVTVKNGSGIQFFTIAILR